MDEWAELALRARDGDRPALARLIRVSQPDVYRFCVRTGPNGQADDLTQETYLRMIKSLHTFKGESAFRTWLLTIARHTVTDAVKKQARRRLFARHETFVDLTEAPDHSIAVKQLVSQLDLERREAFVLTQFIGLSYEEAAVVSGVAVGTIRSRVARARAQLIEIMDSDEVQDFDSGRRRKRSPIGMRK